MPTYTVRSYEREIREVIHQVVADSPDAAVKAVRQAGDNAIFISSTNHETEEYLETISVTEIPEPQGQRKEPAE